MRQSVEPAALPLGPLAATSLRSRLGQRCFECSAFSWLYDELRCARRLCIYWQKPPVFCAPSISGAGQHYILERGVGGGRGVERARGDGVGLGVGVTVALGVAVGVGVALAVAVAVGVAVGLAVGVGVGVGALPIMI